MQHEDQPTPSATPRSKSAAKTATKSAAKPTAKSATASKPTKMKTAAKSATRSGTPLSRKAGEGSGEGATTAAKTASAASPSPHRGGGQGERSKAAKSATTASPSPRGRGGQGERSDQGPHADLLAWRDEFPILSRKLYLNSCSLGALSKRSMAAMSQFQEYWNDYGASAWYELWTGELASLRHKFARLIGAQPHEVAIAPNVSSALGEIASGLDLGERNRVVLAERDFPTLAYQFLARQRLGVEVEMVESPDGITLPVEEFAGHIDERTGLVATSRVFFLSGYIQDIPALAKAAHAKGALLLVDDYQGTGQIPLDVHAAGIDLLVTGTLKWLMGGPGVAFIYVREDLIPRLRPTVTGWWAARDMFAFRVRDLEFRDDAQRLEAGTPAVAAIYAASAALDIVLEVGVERIRERTRYLADDLVQRVLDHGWKLRSPADGAHRSSIVMIGHDRPEEVVHALKERNIIVDSRPGLVRLSPHFYNTIEENEEIIAALEDIFKRLA